MGNHAPPSLSKFLRNNQPYARTGTRYDRGFMLMRAICRR